MITSDAREFGRLITAMVTPFDADKKVDYKAVEKLVEHLIATGTDSIVVAGTTGESPTLEDSEKTELLKAVLQIAGKRAKVIMGTGYNSTAKSVKASKEAEQLGAHALLVVAPYYNKPSQAGLLAHFEEVAKATSLPIFMYNIPGRTGINITSETTVELAKRCPNLYALKDSTGSVEQAADIAGKARSSFHVYSGDDYLTLPFLSVGGTGVVSVASHIVGNEVKEMIEAFYNGKLDRARELHYHLLPLFKGLFAAPNPTCVKYALSLLGLCKPHLRLPLVPLDSRQEEDLKRIIETTTPAKTTRA